MNDRVIRCDHALSAGGSTSSGATETAAALTCSAHCGHVFSSTKAGLATSFLHDDHVIGGQELLHTDAFADSRMIGSHHACKRVLE